MYAPSEASRIMASSSASFMRPMKRIRLPTKSPILPYGTRLHTITVQTEWGKGGVARLNKPVQWDAYA